MLLMVMGEKKHGNSRFANLATTDYIGLQILHLQIIIKSRRDR